MYIRPRAAGCRAQEARSSEYTGSSVLWQQKAPTSSVTVYTLCTCVVMAYVVMAYMVMAYTHA